MKAYADSSFLIRSVWREGDAGPLVKIHRALGRPVLVYTPLHELEVPNALRLKATLDAQQQPKEAARIRRQRDLSLRRLEHNLLTGRFLRASFSWEDAVTEAISLSETFSHRIAARAIDILHVAVAGIVPNDHFITCDKRQAKLAKAVGLKVTLVPLE